MYIFVKTIKSRQTEKHYAKTDHKEEKEQIVLEAKQEEEVWPLLDRLPPRKGQDSLLKGFVREELSMRVICYIKVR